MHIFDEVLKTIRFPARTTELAVVISSMFFFSKIGALVFVVPDFAPAGQADYSVVNNEAFARKLEEVFCDKTPCIAANTVTNEKLFADANSEGFLVFDWNNKVMLLQTLRELAGLGMNDHDSRLLHFESILEGGSCLSEQRIITAMLLAFKILQFKYLRPEESVSLVGLGVGGSQIVHMVSHFLVKPQRDFGVSLAIQLIITLIEVFPFSEVERQLIQAGKLITASVRRNIMQRCAEVLGYDPEILDQAKRVVNGCYSYFEGLKGSVISPVLIQNMFTVGSTFITGAMQPNLAMIGHYYNFYSSSDVSGCFGHNTLRPVLLNDKVGATSIRQAEGKITNFEVKVSRGVGCCGPSFHSPSHNDLINNYSIYILLKVLLAQRALFRAGHFEQLFVAPAFQSRTVAYSVMPLNPDGLSFVLGNCVRQFLCCGCLYNNPDFFNE
jgi:hypothetical protein